MKRARTAWNVMVALCACALAPQRATVERPLAGDEGALFLELEPFPAEQEGLSFEVESISALQHDGAAPPLSLPKALIDSAPEREQVLASGRLPPGAYDGLAMKVVRASAGSTSLAAPAAPLRIDAPFTVSRGAATVLALQIRPGSPKAGTFAPEWLAAVPHRTMPGLAGFTTDFASAQLTEFDRRAHHVTAVLPAGGTPWGIALDVVQARGYAAISNQDRIDVFDLSSGDPIGRIRLNLGDSPREVALTPDRRLLLSANAGSNTVSIVDPLTFSELGRARAGDQPTSLVVDRAGRRAYVANAGSNSVTVVDLAARATAASITTDLQPLRPQLNAAGTRLFVPHAGAPFVNVYSLPSLAPAGRIYVGLGTSAIKLDPRSDLLYVANFTSARIQIFDPASLIPVDAVELPESGAAWLAIDDAENAMLALFPETSRVVTFDLTTRRVLGSFQVGALPRVLALSGERF